MSEFPMGLKRAAVLCILQSADTDRMLLLRREREPHVGKYTPVGGKLEPFETPEAAARREVFEEAGVDVPDLKLCGILTETSPVKYNWIVYVYVGFVQEFEPPACNEGELTWVPLDDVSRIPTPRTDGYIYELVREKRDFILNAIYDENLELRTLRNELGAGDFLYRNEP